MKSRWDAPGSHSFRRVAKIAFFKCSKVKDDFLYLFRANSYRLHGIHALMNEL